MFQVLWSIDSKCRSNPLAQIRQLLRLWRETTGVEVQFDAIRHVQTRPQLGADERPHSPSRRRRYNLLSANDLPNLIQRVPRRLKLANSTELAQVGLPVMSAPSHAARRVDQLLLNVKPDRTATKRRRIRQLPNAQAVCLHDTNYMTANVIFQVGFFGEQKECIIRLYCSAPT
jgi:hypothetical protein